ncbi:MULTISPECIES: hypothetical protein [unclassified Novosphingobium]|uniref:hypothetical protein n=1 Tax=unclassified Novosphingobium TaxID=2644732 RepID=UPI00146C1229|nr:MULTISPECIES: hypothetical protein [unclassified Novosphingobium]NMN07024.1 hypothetical protein [Novosphingobium sp. SG919]NMN89388.1 hypothetical protein [Novosphingobium sp. SG916]
MHTVRNRKGARPGNATPAKPPVPSTGKPAPRAAVPEKAGGHTGGKALVTATVQAHVKPASKGGAKPPFLLGQPAAPAFPADLILPPHRGAIITTAAWPAGMIPAPLPATPPLRAPFIMPRVPATNPQGQPDREAPGRDPRRQDPQRKTPHRDLPPRPGTRTARKAQRRAMIEAELARRAVAAARAAAPAAAESAPPPGRQRTSPAVARQRATAPASGMAAASAPAAPPPSVQWVGPDDRSPLPRHRAPAMPRQGLLDALAASLGDAGRLLASLLPGRKRSRELRERVARAEARLRAMEAQLAALEALRERVKA